MKDDKSRLGEAAARRLARINEARARLADQHAADPVDRYQTRMAKLQAARKRERERVIHLVLGEPRPIERLTVGKRGGRRKPRRVERPAQLSPGIDEAVQLREDWSHKANGTPETWHRAMNTHDGALAQLHRNGTIDNEQLEAAAEIANVYRSIEADVAVTVASLEARVDQSRSNSAMVGESVRRVRMHLAYGYWRDALPPPKQLVLDMIVGDAVGYTIAAKRYGIHNRRAKRLLIAALDHWPACVDRACKLYSAEDIAAAREAA